MVNLEDFGERYPRELSDGQRQRLGIARAVAVEPKAVKRDGLCVNLCSLYVPSPCCRISDEPVMTDQIVITEKTSQAKDVRAAVGSRYGDVLPAEGHLFDLLEPEDIVPEWRRWSSILLRPEGLYGTRPAKGGNKPARLKAICDALRTAKRVWLATLYLSAFAGRGWL
jgi:hypothetical protein